MTEREKQQLSEIDLFLGGMSEEMDACEDQLDQTMVLFGKCDGAAPPLKQVKAS